MPRARSVLVTRNFDRNLAAIRDFLEAAGAPAAFGELVGRLASEVIPNLQRFPALGADFIARAPLSADGIALFEKVVKAAGPHSQVRQLIDGDYLILYLAWGDTVYLLSIKHHRQLSFDLLGHWP
ncbi:MAG TPA: type II toxin-antitoxin system RelE/ParE family toxin [Usitatibacter sp.]|nr:type II toxin-antitoxin system RelE/ParE family toxin [Usitatibacter sp.]